MLLVVDSVQVIRHRTASILPSGAKRLHVKTTQAAWESVGAPASQGSERSSGLALSGFSRNRAFSTGLKS